jgi:ATP phosphoribosyltransferase
VASLTASWSDDALAGLKTLLDRIEAEAAARSLREIRAEVADRASAARAVTERFGARLPFAGKTGPLVVHCPADSVEACADWLREEAGATLVTVAQFQQVFSATSPVYERLAARIGGQR